jgi:hypothetical protein
MLLLRGWIWNLYKPDYWVISNSIQLNLENRQGEKDFNDGLLELFSIFLLVFIHLEPAFEAQSRLTTVIMAYNLLALPTRLPGQGYCV